MIGVRYGVLGMGKDLTMVPTWKFFSSVSKSSGEDLPYRHK